MSQTQYLHRFTTEAHTVYLAMYLSGMTDINGEPLDTVPYATAEERKTYLMTTAKRVVDEVWSTPEQVNEVLDADTSADLYQWCFCGEGNTTCLCYFSQKWWFS